MPYIEDHDTVPVHRHYTTAATRSSSVADILERVLDKGIVITGDIKINLTNVELLTIQIRLVICSVERAMEMGLDWWTTNPNFSSRARAQIPAGHSPAQPAASRRILVPEPAHGPKKV
jgi:Gas vesicle protein